MVHLHEVINCIIEGRMGYHQELEKGILGDAFRGMLIDGPKSMCFDMGDVSQVIGIPLQTELARLPYDPCWFEGTHQDPEGKPVIYGMFCWYTDEEGNLPPGTYHFTTFHFVKYYDRPWAFLGIVFWKKNIDDKHSTFIVHPHPRCSPENPNMFLMELKKGNFWVRVFLSALHCSNVERHEHHPPRQMRRHPGPGQPAFSWWTLHLSIPKESNMNEQNLGGTHASPRLHLRRGHPRRYAPGKWCWVRHHLVGRKELGEVHKDYAIHFRKPEPKN